MPDRTDEDQKLIAQLGHFKQLRKVAQLLSSLHDNGCVRDKAANRELHFDDYVLLILLWMFNPPLLQTDPGLPAPAEHQTGRH
jgi:hypothetical protein